jgi:hypothetical protein
MAPKRSKVSKANVVESVVSKRSKPFKANLGGDLYLTTSTYDGNERVHLRRYASDDDGKLYPTMKGISFDIASWRVFRQNIPDIDRTVRRCVGGVETNYQSCLGNSVYVTLSTDKPFVSIKKYSILNGGGVVVPVKTGISMTFAQWDRFISQLSILRFQKPHFETISPTEANDNARDTWNVSASAAKENQSDDGQYTTY